MKKAMSESGTLHLFESVDVRRATGRNGDGVAEAVCGTFETDGTFTELNDDLGDLDNLCANCAQTKALAEKTKEGDE